MKYPLGTKFVKVGRKNQTPWVVIDYLETTNRKGEIVQVRYVAETTFLGQKMTDNDVCETTIARGILK